MVEMKQKPVNKILCILLTLALVITTMPLTAETAYAAQAAMYMDYDFRVECSDVSLEWNNGDKETRMIYLDNSKCSIKPNGDGTFALNLQGYFVGGTNHVTIKFDKTVTIKLGNCEADHNSTSVVNGYYEVSISYVNWSYNVNVTRSGKSGHSYGKWADNGDGTHTRTCVYNSSHTETGEHSYVYNGCLKPQICNSCGGESAENTEHKWLPATCISPETCDYCSETRGEIDPDNHTNSNYTYGQITGNSDIHNKYHQCCNVFIDTEGHSYSKGKCTKCQYECPHLAWTDGVCDKCKYKCIHENMAGGECTLCHMQGNISYIDRYYDSESKTLAEKNATVPVSSETGYVTSNTTTMSDGWYVVNENVTISERINVSGTVKLILCDGATMTASNGITVSAGNELYIYAQSDDKTKMGRLICSVNTNDKRAGIGANEYKGCGTVIINGGNIDSSGKYSTKNGIGAAGIGGAYGYGGEQITINGGIVYAKGGISAPGIGSGTGEKWSTDQVPTGNVTINGGTVSATGGEYAAGIGGSEYGSGGTVRITGGNIYAKGQNGAYDIGKGAKSNSYGTLTNGDGATLSLYEITVSGMKTESRLKSIDITGCDNYNLLDTYILNNNKIYLYLPEGAYVEKIETLSGQQFAPGIDGSKNLICIHTNKDENNICIHCGDYGLRQEPAEVNGIYQISNLAELKWLADYVAEGKTGNAVLTQDIDATAAAQIGIGKSDKPYTGNFNGNGHTITVALEGGENTAVFPYVDGATIENLTVKGTMEASGKFAASLVSSVLGGTVTLRNCLSSVAIKSSVSGDGTHGGLVGVTKDGSGLKIENCGFNGSITGASTTSCGGLIGWAGADANISNSYVAATFENTTSCNTFARNPAKVTLSGCYYLKTLGETPVAAIYKIEKIFKSGELTYLLNNSNSEGAWKQNVGGEDADNYPNFTGKTVYRTQPCITYTNTHPSGEKTHTYSDGICTACGEGEGIKYENGYYYISTASDLMWFAAFVNEGNDSANAKLTKDLDMSDKQWVPIAQTAIGENVRTGYTGIFDGQGHVISNLAVTMPTSGTTNGLFGTVASNGIVRNLGIDNLTFDNNEYDHRAGGIAGQLMSGGLIENCYVINSTIKASSRVVGGIAGMNKGSIKSCYTAKLTLAGAANRFGGITGDYAGGNIIKCYTDYSSLGSTKSSVGTTDKLSQASVKEEIFASGNIAYLMNNSEDAGVWKQKLEAGEGEEKDIYPKLEGSDIYASKPCFTLSNTAFTEPKEHLIDSVTKCCTVCKGYLEPEQDEDGVYLIANESNLCWFASYVNDENYNANAKLMADLDMNGVPWTPIAPTECYNDYRAGVGYTGTFDGNAHVIKNISMTVSASSKAYGLFGTVSGTVKNLGMVDFSIVVTGQQLYRSMGTVAGILMGGCIEDCFAINPTVDGTSVFCDYVGGIAGSNFRGTVKNCFEMEDGSKNSLIDGMIEGGIVGRNTTQDKDTTGVNCGVVENCYTKESYMTGINRQSSTSNRPGKVNGGRISVTKDEFASGEIAWLLNGDRTGDDIVWYQKIGTDKYPVLIKSQDAVVFKNTSTDEDGNETTSYSNHIHVLQYTVKDNVITESCSAGCDHSATATLQLDTSVSLDYSGTAVRPLKVVYSTEWQGENPEIVYSDDCINAGTHSGSITVGNVTAHENFSISPGNLTGITSEGYEGKYDGETHSITVNGVPSDGKVTYSTSRTGDYGSANPTYKDQGTYTVWYRVEKDNYNTFEGAETVRITQASNSWTVPPSVKDRKYGDTAETPSAASEFGIVKVEYKTVGAADSAYTMTVPTDAGSYKVRFSVDENGNYEGLSEVLDLEIEKVKITVKANDSSKTYGEKDSILTWKLEKGSLVGTDTLKNIFVSRDAGEDAATYTIRVSGQEDSNTNYDIKFESGTFTVTKKTIGIEWGSTSLIYNECEQIPEAKPIGIVNGDEVVLNVSGAAKEVGTDYVATVIGISGADSGNYVLTKNTAELSTTFSIQRAAQGGSNIPMLPSAPSSPGTPSVPSAPSNEITTDTSTGTTTSKAEIKIDETNKATASVTVSEENRQDVIEEVKKNDSKEIILEVSNDDFDNAELATGSEEGSAATDEKIEVTVIDVKLEKDFLESIINDTEADLTIRTPLGDMTYTQDEIKELLEGSTGETVTVKITAENIEAKKLAEVKATLKTVSFAARSSVTNKKNIRVTLRFNDESVTAIQSLEKMGYTIKYKYYRSTKKAARYKAKMSNTSYTYTNTTGDKDTKYYYKARVQVIDKDGNLLAQTALKQCRFACRKWVK